MSADLKEWVPAGLFTLLAALIAGLFRLFHKRAANQINNDNASADRHSRFEENLQARHDALLVRIDTLTLERDSLKSELEQARTRLTVVQMVADNDPRRAVEITQDSAFVDMSRPLRLRPAPRPAGPPMDPFQAADPYAPPPRKPRKP